MSREQALKRMEAEGAVSEERLLEVCQILDLPEETISALRAD